MDALPLISAIERINTANVIAPLFVVDIVVGVVALIGSAFIPAPIPIALWVLFGFCVLFTLGAYVYWSLRAPNRLQTERYQLEHQRMLLIGDERDPNSAKFITAQATANTHVEAAQ
jgi:hypothetical protein